MLNLGKIIGILRAHKSDGEVKCFCKVQDCDGTFTLIDRGGCNVSVKQIVGSVGKCLDFDRNFNPRHHVPPDRVISIKRAMREGKILPPIKLYKIEDEYYVLDGNHRIAAARQLGRSLIEAKVVEVVPSIHTCSVTEQSE